jgi:hypothetical protein
MRGIEEQMPADAEGALKILVNELLLRLYQLLRGRRAY